MTWATAGIVTTLCLEQLGNLEHICHLVDRACFLIFKVVVPFGLDHGCSVELTGPREIQSLRITNVFVLVC